MKRYLLSVLVLFLGFGDLFGQCAPLGEFFRLSGPERVWVVCHPFSAAKVHKITAEVLSRSKDTVLTQDLDQVSNGGQSDAFRHALWMARVTRARSGKVARSLGKAHEKGNYKDFLKGRFEDGGLADSTASAMDLYNNEVGIRLAEENPEANDRELEQIILKAIQEGQMMIIDKKGPDRLRDKDRENDRVEGKKLWNRGRELIPSNLEK